MMKSVFQVFLVFSQLYIQPGPQKGMKFGRGGDVVMRWANLPPWLRWINCSVKNWRRGGGTSPPPPPPDPTVLQVLENACCQLTGLIYGIAKLPVCTIVLMYNTSQLSHSGIFDPHSFRIFKYAEFWVEIRKKLLWVFELRFSDL